MKDMGSDEIKVFEMAKSQVGAVSGLDVFTLGFPLGQDNVAFTKGTLAGSEEVGGYLVLQHTAPISPGNSGGPLLVKGDDGSFKVLGINFAAANAFGSQNNNYAIFGKRVTQMVTAAKRLMKDAGGHAKLVENCASTPQNCEYRVPRMDMTLVPPSKDVYDYYGCESGVLMTHVGKKSMMRWGIDKKNPVAENAFITEVGIETDGKKKTIKLDKFGMGKDEDIVQDPVHFRDILFMNDDLDKKVTLTTCSCGHTEEHELSLGWTKEYNAAVPDIVQPSSAKIDYDHFAGVTVQGLNKQLAVLLVTKAEVLSLIPYVMEEDDGKPQQPVIVATQAPPPEMAGIEDDNWRGIFAPGAVIESVNGKKVHTLDDYRAALNPKSADKSSCAAAGEKEEKHEDKVATFLQTGECKATSDDAVVVFKTVDGAVFATKFMDALREMVKPGDPKKQEQHQLTKFQRDLAKANCIDVPDSLLQAAPPSGFMQGAVKSNRAVKFQAIETRLIDRGGRITDFDRAAGWS